MLALGLHRFCIPLPFWVYSGLQTFYYHYVTHGICALNTWGLIYQNSKKRTQNCVLCKIFWVVFIWGWSTKIVCTINNQHKEQYLNKDFLLLLCLTLYVCATARERSNGCSGFIMCLQLKPPKTKQKKLGFYLLLLLG